jgi:hypothetical protein
VFSFGVNLNWQRVLPVVAEALQALLYVTFKKFLLSFLPEILILKLLLLVLFYANTKLNCIGNRVVFAMYLIRIPARLTSVVTYRRARTINRYPGLYIHIRQDRVLFIVTIHYHLAI